MKSFNFLLKEREEKPRQKGITMVLDKGLGLETAESLMNISGDYVDYLKFGWGTSIVHEQDIIKDKVAMYKSHNITSYTGGTLFELAYMNDKLEEFFQEAHDLGFEAIEVSDGSTTISHDKKLECIESAKKDGFEVLSEVGKKDPGLDKEDEIDYILDNFDGNKILWEAPNKDQQVFFILKLGNDVNLGNVSTDDITSLETLRRGLRGDTVGKI